MIIFVFFCGLPLKVNHNKRQKCSRCQLHLLKRVAAPHYRLHLSDGDSPGQSPHRIRSGRQSSFYAPWRRASLAALRARLTPSPFSPYLGAPKLFSSPFGRLVHHSTAVRLSIKAVSVTELGQGHG